MNLTLKKDDSIKQTEILIKYREASEELSSIVNYINSLNNITVYDTYSNIVQLPFNKIVYFEVVDNKSFVYTKDSVYDSKLKLYEFEEITADKTFFRASKSSVINYTKIDHITPSLSGKFVVTLNNKEKQIVSRKYVPVLRKKLGL